MGPVSPDGPPLPLGSGRTPRQESGSPVLEDIRWVGGRGPIPVGKVGSRTKLTLAFICRMFSDVVPRDTGCPGPGL